MKDQTAFPIPAGSKLRAKKKNQLPWFWLVLILALAAAWVLGTCNSRLVFFWAFGIVYGLVFQRSRFCPAAGVRDGFITRDFSNAQTLVLILLLTTIGYSVLQYWTWVHHCPIPGHLAPFGWTTAVGGLLFGVGMVLVGNCVLGALVRLGEGHAAQLLALTGIIFGSTLAAYLYSRPFFKLGVQAAVYLPCVLGWPLALGLQLAFLGAIYWWLKRQP